MIRHLFRLIWNKKKAHALLMVEIWASFLVLFGLGSMIVFNVSNYVEPLGFSYERVWAVDFNNNQDTTAMQDKVNTILQRLKAYPEVESVSRMSSNYPFSTNTMNNGVDYKKRHVMSHFYTTAGDFAQTLDMPLVDGRGYGEGDLGGKYKPVVINRKTQEALFLDENPLGKVFGDFRVVGVIDNFKAKGEFMTNAPAVFEMIEAKNTWDKIYLVKTKPGTDAMFEAKLVKEMSTMLVGWNVEVNPLVDSRKNQHNLTLVPVIIFLIICFFLLINVALGLFGVLNLSIAKRRSEIGLRRAIGATARQVSWQFVAEIWVLATFSLLFGLLFAVQFPIMHVFDLASGVYIGAIALAVAIIYGLVTLCALFPSRQAATIHPAVALHEE